MKKFRYSLEKVLQYKDQVLDSQKEEYASRMRDVNQQKQRIDALNREQEELEEKFDSAKHSGSSITDLRLFADLTDRIGRQIEIEQNKLHNLEELAEKQKGKMIAANVDVKKFEKLKDRKLQDYQKEVRKSDETFIEEFVMHEAAVDNMQRV